MTDRRLFRSNGRIAHVSLRGQVEAARFVEGEVHRVTSRVAALLDRPNGDRERELLFGQDFTVLEQREGHAFGFCARDGYVGYLSTVCLVRAVEATTHVVNVRQTYTKATPDLKKRNEVMILCHGSRVRMREEQDGWARIDLPGDDGATSMYVPAQHLVPVDTPSADPATVATLYLGTPYLWGGNSSIGIDCSGLVQAACLACGLACPGDSDMQAQALGVTLPEDAALRRGDLIFWQGHVAMVVDETRLIHANVHHMAVAFEGIVEATGRIASQGGGPVTLRRRFARSV